MHMTKKQILVSKYSLCQDSADEYTFLIRASQINKNKQRLNKIKQKSKNACFLK